MLLSLLFIQAKQCIAIYNDEGASPWCVACTKKACREIYGRKYRIKLVDSKKIKKDVLNKETVLFIMPGGADLPYCKKLNGAGNKKIKAYVEKGGKFLGLCAGSYYAGKRVEFDKGGKLEVVGDRELGFFPGAVIGSCVKPYVYKSEKGATIAEVMGEGKTQWSAYYNGGGYFAKPYAANVKVLARYNKDQAAIVQCSFGKGWAVLSGVHPEVSADDLIEKVQGLTESDPNVPILRDNAVNLGVGEAKHGKYQLLKYILTRHLKVTV